MQSHRSLQTILFTDIVGSTERATKLGDRAWRKLRERHHRVVREELRRWGGHEVTEAGDGFLALFDNPARAIVCAHAIRDRVQELGLEVRCGLHMGQAEREADGSVGGIAVHIGARVAGKAGPGEVLVTSAVRDAEAGSGFAVEDLGRNELKGVDREWRLFRVTGLPADAEGLAAGRWERIRHRIGPRRAAAVGTLAAVVALAAYVALRASGSEEAVASRIRSMAVLPLENLSGDPQQEYFADGMTDALITELSKIGALQVISRISAMRYKGTDQPLPEIANELGVAGIVVGSVVRADDRVRISVQLVHAGTDAHVWAESYEGDLTDVLRLQGEVARAIAREIQVAVTPEEQARLAAEDPVDPEAYVAYLKGRFHWYKFTPSDVRTALRHFRLALEKDPESALAYAGIASVWIYLAAKADVPPSEAGPRARAAAEKAIELNDGIAEAHTALARVRGWIDWDWSGAERGFQRALELDPNFAHARVFYSHLLAAIGRPDESTAQIERALELDPLNTLFRQLYAAQLLFLDRYDEAVVVLEDVLANDPDSPSSHALLGVALHQTGRYEEALTEAKELAAKLDDRAGLEALERGYARAGYRGALREVAETLEARSRTTYVIPTTIAGMYARAGEHDRALDWLRKAIELRDVTAIYIGVVPVFEPLHNDPRFQDLLNRLELPPPEPARGRVPPMTPTVSLGRPSGTLWTTSGPRYASSIEARN